MTETIHEIMARMPGFVQDNFNKVTTRENAQVTNTNHGELALIAEEAEKLEPETIAPQAPAPFAGRIRPGIYAERGDEISIWRNGSRIAVQYKGCGGDIYYGAPAPVLMAEGGFGPSASDEDRAFVHETIRDVVETAKFSQLPVTDYNRSAFATALWTNMDRTGPAVPRAFLVFEWSRIGDGQVPLNVIVFDGDRTKFIKLERTDRKNPRSPHWIGRVR